MTPKQAFTNPFRPGAGHTPPYLAGRVKETNEFSRLLQQETILENAIITGLRGTGKTVLLESFKPIATHAKWKWAGADLSESASVSEDNLVLRLLADLSVVTSNVVASKETTQGFGFTQEATDAEVTLNYNLLKHIYDDTPGLVTDKLKFILEFSWKFLKADGFRGLIFAYDEAQNMTDQFDKDEYPLSVLLDTFQSLQRKELPIMLVLTGLPTLFPKLVKARTYSERMFHIVELDRLNEDDSRQAITKPIEKHGCPVKLQSEGVDKIIELSGGYPYFIQFICKEVYDAVVQGATSVPVNEIVQKLDNDFFAARWAKATDRQRELLALIANLENCDAEFSVKDVVEQSQTFHDVIKPFSPSNTSQMLVSLEDHGLVYKNRYGKYRLAVPLMGDFIRRETSDALFSRLL